MSTEDPLSVDEILDGKIWLGNIASALSSALLDELRITHILSVCPDLPVLPPTISQSMPREHLCISVEDYEYGDLLSHFSRTTAFITRALDKGRVLVHCRMGISRSATVLAAWFMQMRKLSPVAALSLIRRRRPCIRPNYGFIAQLEVWEQSGYKEPFKPTPKSKSAWKKRVKNFLCFVADAIEIPFRETSDNAGEAKLFLSSDFPVDEQMAESVLVEIGITHLLWLGGSDIPKFESWHVQCKCIPKLESGYHESTSFLRNAIDSGGRVLVYNKVEAQACISVAAFFMATLNVTSLDAIRLIQHALPLFEPSPNVQKALDDCAASCSSSSTMPDDSGLLLPHSRESSLSSVHSSTSLSPPSHAQILPSASPTADDLASLSAHILSDTGVDFSAFGDTLKGLSINKDKIAVAA